MALESRDLQLPLSTVGMSIPQGQFVQICGALEPLTTVLLVPIAFVLLRF